jgi:hypothetical protein
MGDTIIEAPAPEGIASRPLRSSGSAKPQIAAATSAFSRYGFAPGCAISALLKRVSSSPHRRRSKRILTRQPGANLRRQRVVQASPLLSSSHYRRYVSILARQ